jgi:hypothetical protein
MIKKNQIISSFCDKINNIYHYLQDRFNLLTLNDKSDQINGCHLTG